MHETVGRINIGSRVFKLCEKLEKTLAPQYIRLILALDIWDAESGIMLETVKNLYLHFVDGAIVVTL